MIDNKLVSDFKRPRGATFKLLKQDKNIAVFTASPYERGFGTTVANSLRRTLLSAMPGYAIIAARFEGCSNEFDNIPGVIEDTPRICLNLKRVAIAFAGDDVKNRVLHFEIKGKKTFKAVDLQKDETIVVGNPDLILFHTTEEADFSFDLQVAEGRGYVPSEIIEGNIEVRGTIPLDSAYSPIRNVAFNIQKISVSGKNDFEKLEMTVETNGLVTPEKAFRDAAQILKECYYTFNELEEELMTTAIDSVTSSTKSRENEVYHRSVHSLQVLIKTHYFFKVNGICEIGQLVTQSEADLRARKRFDEEILFDIISGLRENSLTLNMKGVNYVAQSQ